MSRDEFQYLQEIKAKHRHQLMSLPNVIGVGVGRKVVGGDITDQNAIRVYVTKKVPLERLEKDERVPSKVDDVPTDVVQIGEPRFLTHKTRVRPARGGDSIGDCILVKKGCFTAGTLGGLFIDNTDGAEVILSNNHVIAGFDDETIKIASAGDAVVQPGTYDWGNCKTDVIAELKRWIRFKLPPLWNRVDAAIAQVAAPGNVLDSIYEIGTPTGYRALTTADECVTYVQKSGRATQYTRGLVYDVSFDVGPLTGAHGNKAQFREQILIQPLGSGWKWTPVMDSGDSGSLILDLNRKVVGLLFAGTTDGWAFANHIGDVLGELDIRLPSPTVSVCMSLICLSEMICWELITQLPSGEGSGPYASIDLAKIPPQMRRSVEKMLQEIQKDQEGQPGQE